MFAHAADDDTGFDDTESAGGDAAVFAGADRSMRVQQRKHRRRTRHNGAVGAAPAAAEDGAAAAATTTNGTIGHPTHATRYHPRTHTAAANAGWHWRCRRGR